MRDYIFISFEEKGCFLGANYSGFLFFDLFLDFQVILEKFFGAFLQKVLVSQTVVTILSICDYFLPLFFPMRLLWLGIFYAVSFYWGALIYLHALF